MHIWIKRIILPHSVSYIQFQWNHPSVLSEYKENRLSNIVIFNWNFYNKLHNKDQIAPGNCKHTHTHNEKKKKNKRTTTIYATHRFNCIENSHLRHCASIHNPCTNAKVKWVADKLQTINLNVNNACGILTHAEQWTFFDIQ